jgi:Spy/CpxP family protein refolding chaperone
MNKKMKFGLTIMTVGALAISSVGAFASTATVTGMFNGGHQGIVDLMLKDGVITQTQIDKYQTQMQTERHAEVKASIQTLVTKGTLTQAKADAVLKTVEAQQVKMQAYHDKIATMTQEEAKAYIEKNPMPRGEGLLTLVENGTLTAAEFDSLRGVMGRGGEMGGKGMMNGGHMDGKGGMGRGPGMMGK